MVFLTIPIPVKCAIKYYYVLCITENIFKLICFGVMEIKFVIVVIYFIFIKFNWDRWLEA